MYRLPLFPLPVVLLPSEILPLHVFEPRYRRLVEVALEEGQRFGVLYHDPDRSGPFLSEEGRVGCLAEIQAHQALEDGRSLIVTRGVERFEIREGIESKEPFYEAVAEPYLDEAGVARPERREPLHRLRARVRDRFSEVARGRVVDALPDLDLEDEVSFSLAALVHAEVEWKQRFLEERSEVRRLAQLEEALRSVDVDPLPPTGSEAP